MIALPHNITDVQFDESYSFSKEVQYFTQIPELNPIPSNSIIYKTVTGLGATHSEIIAERDSIIVLPHVSIVKSKEEYYKESHRVFAVHGDVSVHDIRKHLASEFEYVKLLTTPQGLKKIKWALEPISHIYDYTKSCFLLIDECHKAIQDCDYRSDVYEIFDTFFEFERKAMISATPIPPSDPRFKKSDDPNVKRDGFRNIKVFPDYDDWKPKIELIHADSIINGLQKYLRENPSDGYFIFFNSVEVIKTLISHLKLDGDYKIFCSEESSMILRKNNELKSSSTLDDFAKYNFFTSSFFNGLDIKVPYKPNIVILTDYGYREHTLLDPFTDIVQMIGRVRKHDKDDVPYNKITHINNASSFTNPISEQDVLIEVEKSKRVYNAIEDLKNSMVSEDLSKVFDQALSAIKPYYHLLDKNGAMSTFLLDNHLDSQRVKNYYSSPSALLNAYMKAGQFKIVGSTRECYDKAKLIELTSQSLRNSKAMNKLMAETLFQLDDYQGLEVYHQERYEVAKLSYVIYDGYNRLGYETIQSMKLNKKCIKQELLKLDIQQQRNSFPVINIVYSTFQLNRYYNREETKEILQVAYDELGVPLKAKANDVERYFEFKEKKIDDQRHYVFLSQKYSPVSEIKHI